MWSPQDWNMWWLDRILVRIGICCGPCGAFKWDHQCYAAKHWFQEMPNRGDQ